MKVNNPTSPESLLLAKVKSYFKGVKTVTWGGGIISLSSQEFIISPPNKWGQIECYIVEVIDGFEIKRCLTNFYGQFATIVERE